MPDNLTRASDPQDINPHEINSPENEDSPDQSADQQNRRSHSLLHPEERLRLIEENVRDYAIVIMAADGKIVNWNAGAERIMGWTEAEAIGQPASMFYTPEDRKRGIDAQELERSAGEGRAVDEQWHLRKDGSYFWASGFLTALRDNDGSLRGFTKILRDMTEQRQAQEAQKQAQEELSAAYERLAAAYAREQRTAEVLQRSLLLASPTQIFDGLELTTHYEPASDDLLVGGDFFDAFRLADGQVAFLVGDVVGKGLNAAAHTAQIKFALRAFVREYPQPAIAVQRLNSFLCEAERLNDLGDGTETRFVVLCLGVIDPASGEMQFAGAGIEPPLIVRANGETEPVKTSGLPLGMAESAEFILTKAHLDKGDLVLLTTDGITEARRGKEFLDYEGLMRLAEQARSLPSLEQMVRFIVEGAREFGGSVFRDDVCLLLARRH